MRCGHSSGVEFECFRCSRHNAPTARQSHFYCTTSQFNFPFSHCLPQLPPPSPTVVVKKKKKTGSASSSLSSTGDCDPSSEQQQPQENGKLEHQTPRVPPPVDDLFSAAMREAGTAGLFLKKKRKWSKKSCKKKNKTKKHLFLCLSGIGEDDLQDASGPGLLPSGGGGGALSGSVTPSGAATLAPPQPSTTPFHHVSAPSRPHVILGAQGMSIPPLVLPLSHASVVIPQPQKVGLRLELYRQMTERCCSSPSKRVRGSWSPSPPAAPVSTGNLSPSK